MAQWCLKKLVFHQLGQAFRLAVPPVFAGALRVWNNLPCGVLTDGIWCRDQGHVSGFWMFDTYSLVISPSYWSHCHRKFVDLPTISNWRCEPVRYVNVYQRVPRPDEMNGSWRPWIFCNGDLRKLPKTGCTFFSHRKWPCSYGTWWSSNGLAMAFGAPSFSEPRCFLGDLRGTRDRTWINMFQAALIGFTAGSRRVFLFVS
jgi:hypothetical protein